MSRSPWRCQGGPVPRSAPRPRPAALALLTGAAALAAAALACHWPCWPPPRPAPSPPSAYVALGDSYSSGVGAGSYIGSSGSCDQSTKAYPALWDAASQPASYVSEACSGATTATVLSSQLSALSVGHHPGVHHGRRQRRRLLLGHGDLRAAAHEQLRQRRAARRVPDRHAAAGRARLGAERHPRGRAERAGGGPRLPGALRPVPVLVLHRPEHDRPDRPQPGRGPAGQPDPGGRGPAR